MSSDILNGPPFGRLKPVETSAPVLAGSNTTFVLARWYDFLLAALGSHSASPILDGRGPVERIQPA